MEGIGTLVFYFRFRMEHTQHAIYMLVRTVVVWSIPPSSPLQGKGRQTGKTGSEKRVGTFVPRWVHLFLIALPIAECSYILLTHAYCTLMLHESLIWISLSINKQLAKKTDRPESMFMRGLEHINIEKTTTK